MNKGKRNNEIQAKLSKLVPCNSFIILSEQRANAYPHFLDIQSSKLAKESEMNKGLVKLCHCHQ